MKIFYYRLAKKNIDKMVDFYSQFNPSSLSIKQFIDFGLKANEQKSYQFLKKELPVRLANIMKEIRLLPDNLLKMPSVGLVNTWYTQSFDEMIDFEMDDGLTELTLNNFCNALIKIRNRHADVVQTMAQGVIELKDSYDINAHTKNNIQYFLDRFYMSRIGIRMLINQHTLLFGDHINTNKAHRQHIGCIDPCCDVVSVVKDAYENARFLCDQYYLASPELQFVKHTDGDDESIKIIYVPSHLYHMLFELFKNAMRATVEHHKTDVLPPLLVTIVKGKEDICVKVSDQGGGIPRTSCESLFHYMYSTAPQPSKSDAHTVPLAGYGYGLPISRLYARYLHGDLVLLSCDGYGTDAIIYLKALSNEANELLPIFNKMSTKCYKTTEHIVDWRSATNHLSSSRHTTETQ